MLSGCAMIPVTNRIAKTSAAEIPHAQKTTLRNPSWKMANPMMPSKNSQCIYWHLVSVQDTGCVVLKGSFLWSEWFVDSAIDVTMIAAPMAFCRGVSEAHPVVKQNKQTSKVFIESSVIRGNGIIARVANGN